MERAMSQTIDPRRPAKSESAFRTISEVAEDLDVPQHVLRFWETKFTQIRPMKRGGGRRYYRPEDVALLRRIRSLLYDDGFTIKGVQKLLREGGLKPLDPIDADDEMEEQGAAPAPADVISVLEQRSEAAALPEQVKGVVQSVIAELSIVSTLLREASKVH
ncbi:MerR HTH family regulatory protein [Insolitispirillum peregrinum]|uniref:MerR HTH family regulatory protein n=2 Tax=Insolitispirillum peregrinum TaxID=80876 RepID=A0A1N7IQB5_9PROT|nr:MerR HTH family regulatory protein [Insolitispirillum peregrinum]